MSFNKAKIIRRFWHFRANENGVVAVEFALILPILLLLYLGAVETSRAVTFNKKMVNAAADMGDLVARVKGSISENELDDYFAAARITMSPLSADNLKQVVSSVYIDENGDTSVIWSRGYNGGQAHAEGSAYEIPDDIAGIAEDGYIIVSKASLTYQPITNFIFTNGFTFEKEFFLLPRHGEEIELN